jgi:hypothetical protein
MGLRFSKKYLHDGRTTSLEEGVPLPGSKGAAGRDCFAALPITAPRCSRSWKS